MYFYFQLHWGIGNLRTFQYLKTLKFGWIITMKVTNNIPLVIPTSFICFYSYRLQALFPLYIILWSENYEERAIFSQVFLQSFLRETIDSCFWGLKNYEALAPICSSSQVFFCKSRIIFQNETPVDGFLQSLQDIFMVRKGYLKLFLSLVVTILKKWDAVITFTDPYFPLW